MDEFGRLFDPSWAALEARLAAVVRTALDSGYWAGHGDAFTIRPQNPANMQARPPCRRPNDEQNPQATESRRRRIRKNTGVACIARRSRYCIGLCFACTACVCSVHHSSIFASPWCRRQSEVAR